MSDVGVFSLLKAINRGVPVEDEDEFQEVHGTLNGFPAAPLCELNVSAWWGDDAEEVLSKVNTALGTDYDDMEDMWLPAASRPHAPELFAALRDPPNE